ncbi:MAG: response regulator [Bacteroidales bacterium]|nr:response regulator [Bacteroidales bacterium]
MDRLIFFVDDDKMMLNLMEYTFKCRPGFEVKSYFSGEDCLKNIKLKPELIVLDYYMGSAEENTMTGLDTLKKINEIDKNIPVVILSREKDKDTINEFIKEGAMKYVVKDDYFIDTLIDTIEGHFTTV